VFLTGSEGKKGGSLRKEKPRRGKGRRSVYRMDFCPKCGTRLTLTKKPGSEAALLLSCRRCSYEKQAVGLMPAILKIIDHPPQECIAVIGKEVQKLRTFPTARIQCCRCGNKLAFTWMVQTRRVEESSTQFFRCTKCSYTFRENS